MDEREEVFLSSLVREDTNKRAKKKNGGTIGVGFSRLKNLQQAEYVHKFLPSIWLQEDLANNQAQSLLERYEKINECLAKSASGPKYHAA